MSDISPATWKEIEKESFTRELVEGYPELVIPLKTLRKILLASRRSLDQNALIHVLFDEAIKKGGEALAGWTREDMKEWALGEYSGWDRVEALGRVRLKPKRRSSRMTKTEMKDFIEWYVRTMAEHGILLDLPGDVAA